MDSDNMISFLPFKFRLPLMFASRGKFQTSKIEGKGKKGSQILALCIEKFERGEN